MSAFVAELGVPMALMCGIRTIMITRRGNTRVALGRSNGEAGRWLGRRDM